MIQAEIDRQTDRQTDRQSISEIDRNSDRDMTDGQADRQRKGKNKQDLVMKMIIIDNRFGCRRHRMADDKNRCTE